SLLRTRVSLTTSSSSVIYALSLHDALPIFYSGIERFTFNLMPLAEGLKLVAIALGLFGVTELIFSVREPVGSRVARPTLSSMIRSEEHTSELQSRENLVCRLLLEKKKYIVR